MATTMPRLRFSHTEPACDRVHYLTEDDVTVLIGRLPQECYQRLRVIHFNDAGRGARLLGYVTKNNQEIAICALPPRVSLTRFLHRGQFPEQFGAKRRTQWPKLAVRRFLLYDVFLHELGHLQLVDDKRGSEKLRFAREKMAQEFSGRWRKRLWSVVDETLEVEHNPPSVKELQQIE